MKTNLSINISTDTLGALALAAHNSNDTLNAFVESILEDFVSPAKAACDGQQEFTFEDKCDKLAKTAVDEPYAPATKEAVEQTEESPKDLTRPPFNKYGEKPVPVKPKTTTNTWVDPDKKKTTNSWLF